MIKAVRATHVVQAASVIDEIVLHNACRRRHNMRISAALAIHSACIRRCVNPILEPFIAFWQARSSASFPWALRSPTPGDSSPPHGQALAMSFGASVSSEFFPLSSTARTRKSLDNGCTKRRNKRQTKRLLSSKDEACHHGPSIPTPSPSATYASGVRRFRQGQKREREDKS